MSRAGRVGLKIIQHFESTGELTSISKENQLREVIGWTEDEIERTVDFCHYVEYNSSLLI